MTTSILDIMRRFGLKPVANCGLTKNMRKRRNRKMTHAALSGGPDGLRALMSSTAFNTYINPARIQKKIHNPKTFVECPSSLSGINLDTSSSGGWGYLPNVSQIDYEYNDPRGWTHVGPHKRNRGCKIVDDPEDFAV